MENERAMCPNCGEPFPRNLQLKDFERIIMTARHEAMNLAILKFPTGDHRREEFFERDVANRVAIMVGKSHLFRAPCNLVDFNVSKFIPENRLREKKVG